MITRFLKMSIIYPFVVQGVIIIHNSYVLYTKMTLSLSCIQKLNNFFFEKMKFLKKYFLSPNELGLKLWLSGYGCFCENFIP